MKYIGSKSRISRDLAPIIQKYIDDYGIKTYIEPFVGGANMIDKIVCETKIGIDINEYLIEFWKQIQNGWNPMDDVVMTKEFYVDVRDNKDKYPKHIVALCGLLATYNAKWFGGYSGTVQTKAGNIRNYYDEAVRNVLQQQPSIIGVQFIHGSYDSINPNGCLIYCDPPYQGTTKYKDDFNHEIYWDWVRRISKNNIVLCSEYNSPETSGVYGRGN